MHSGSHSFHPNDFSKTVLSWSFETLAAPLESAMQQAPLPKRERSVARYYNNFIAFHLEEARAIIASGLEQVEQYNEQLSRKGKKNKRSSQQSDAKPFKLILKKQTHYSRNEGNPLSMTFRGAIPNNIEHGKSMNVLLLKTKGITPEKQFIALATENPDSSELFIKIVMSSSDYYSYQECFSQDREWQAHYLGSVISEQRMYDACLEATDIPCVQQIARGQIATPNVTRVSTKSVDLGKMNLSQKEAIFAFLNAREGSTLLLQGPPGTGKTTTLVSLLKEVASLGKRTMVCAHSNKGVHVLALRVAVDMPDVPMIVIGVESKLPEALKPHFLNRWYDIIQSRLIVHHDEVELLAQGNFNALSTPIANVIANIGTNIFYVLQALSRFNLVDSRKLSLQNRQALFALSQDPVFVGDFQSFQTHMNSLKQSSNNKKNWDALLGVLNRLIDKWSRISKEALENYLLDHASIVFSTLISAGRKGLSTMAPIDFLLVDEAAQSVESATLIPMRFKPSKVLLVGDTKQLPATVISRALDDSNGRPSKNYKWSMMWRLIEELNQPSLMLTIQYRMHPHICQWPSGQYYADRLITAPDILPMSLLSNTNITSRPYAIYQISGTTQSLQGSHSMCNPEEAQYVIQIIEHIRRQNKTQSIGVITPYAAQKRLISDHLLKKRYLLPDVDVNTVDGFQGDERDVIIISFTRTHVSEFLKEFRRLNVAITRPKACLIILGAPTLLSNDIGQLMADARLRNVLYSEEDLNNILTSGSVPTVTQQSNINANQRDLAWQGNPHHQFNYARTFGTSDWKTYFLWVRRSAENNHSQAQYHISKIYLSGNALIKKDIQLGVNWLEKSARNYFPPAQFTLGKLFVLGEIIVKNVDVGIAYCKQAADNGYLEAILFLAKCYDEGQGVIKNNEHAENYYRRAAKLDDADSIIKLATLLFRGGLDDQREAIQWYKKAAEKNIVAAYYPLACLHNTVLNDHVEALRWYLKSKKYSGLINPSEDFEKESYPYFKRAALQNHAPAQYKCIHYQIKFNCDLTDCLDFCEQLALQNNPQIQFLLARLLDTGIAGSIDKVRAYYYYSLLANNGHPLAHYYGGIIWEEGIEVTRDLEQACQHYEFCQEYHLNARLRLACLLLEKESGELETRQPDAVDSDEDDIEIDTSSCIPRRKEIIRATRFVVTENQKQVIALLSSYDTQYKVTEATPPKTTEEYLEKLIKDRFENHSVYSIRNMTIHSAEIHYLLGKIFQEGKGVAINIERALQHYQSASIKHPDAIYRIGYIYETGLTGEKNWFAAKRFYQRAADNGHELAAKRLTWSYSIFNWNSVPDDVTLKRTEENNCLIM